MASIKTIENKTCPFPGLRPFMPEESSYYFGRDTEIEEIAAKLLKNRFVAVTGAPGTGKSSLVMCGLLPYLKNLTENEKWQFVIMKPGNNPFDNLCRSLVENLSNPDKKRLPVEEILKILTENPDGISEIRRITATEENVKIVLFIDQFEELFRYGSPESGIGTGPLTSRFIHLLTNTITGNDPRFHLIITLRSDLISECSHYRSFTNMVNSSNFLLSGIQNENFRQIITGPLRNSGTEMDNELVDLLVNELNDNPDQLLMLQHTLMRCWLHWKEADEPDRPIDISDYRAIGTMKDSISNHAEEIYESLGIDGKVICERIFKIITGKGSDGKGIRYPSNIRTLKSAAGCSVGDLTKVIDAFRNPNSSMLIPHSAVQLNDDSIIDLSYENLIDLWDRLHIWVEEEYSSVQMYIHLSEASALYQQGKAGLLKPPDLQLAIKWRDINNPNLSWARKYNPAFERAMVYLRTSEKGFIESEERKIQFNKRKLKRIRIISSVLGGIAFLALIATAAAVVSKHASDNRRRIAEREKAEIASQKEASDKYASEVLRKSVTSDSTALAAIRSEQMERIMRLNAENQVTSVQNELFAVKKQSESVIQAGMLANSTADSLLIVKNETQRLRMLSVAKSMSLRSLQVPENKDLQALLAMQAYLFNRKNRGSRNDADIYMGLYNLAKLRGSTILKNFSGLSAPVKGIAFVPGRSEFFASDTDGKILKLDLKNTNNINVIFSGSEVFDVLAVSPGVEWLACGGTSSIIKMLPIAGNKNEFDLKGHTGRIRSLIFSYNGKYLYSAAIDGRVLKWDISAKTSVDLNSDLLKITSIDISASNRYLAGIDEQGKALIWNPEITSDKFTIESPGREIRAIKFNPDEKKIAIGYNNGIIELWDVTMKSKISEFQAHEGRINNLRFNGKASQLASAGNDGLLKLWDTDDLKSPPVSFNDNGGIVVAMEFSSDGEVFVSGSEGSQQKLTSRPAYADSFAADGCAYITRNFTPDEWLAYIGKDINYEKTCPESEFRIRVREIR